MNEEFSQSLMRHVSNECRILGDSIANTMDQVQIFLQLRAVQNTIFDLA